VNETLRTEKRTFTPRLDGRPCLFISEVSPHHKSHAYRNLLTKFAPEAEEEEEEEDEEEAEEEEEEKEEEDEEEEEEEEEEC